MKRCSNLKCFRLNLLQSQKFIRSLLRFRILRSGICCLDIFQSDIPWPEHFTINVRSWYFPVMSVFISTFPSQPISRSSNFPFRRCDVLKSHQFFLILMRSNPKCSKLLLASLEKQWVYGLRGTSLNLLRECQKTVHFISSVRISLSIFH